MDNIQDFFNIWKKNIKPPFDKQDSHNSRLSINFSDINIYITGVVCWSDKLQLYVFHFLDEMTEKNEKYKVKFGCAIFDSEHYLYIRNTLREEFGIYATGDIYDIMCPPRLPDKSDFYFEQETSSLN